MTDDILNRFWSKVNKGSKCWNWTASYCGGGYGKIVIGGRKGKLYSSHRLSWEIEYGCIPKGMHICHHCDNKLCVRPSHLFIGTRKDNMQDAVKKERITKGEKQGNSKLIEEQIKSIRTDLRTEMVVASEYNVNRATIGKIKRKETWKHIK